MNYPVWDVAFGSQWLIAVIAVVHVFISHFAIGGGLLLVLLEGRAYKQDDPALLSYLKRHSRFFVFLTLVVGAVTGVGIWFTIGLISPEATSELIHTFVWVWAIEWVFFLVEILAILVYYKTWDTLPRSTHRIVGWVYFAAAYLSLVAIDGILAFQLTPGRWPETHSLWNAYFNPNLWPSLLMRTLICAMLGGLYGLLTLSWSKDKTLKGDLARTLSTWVLLPALALPGLGWWFVVSVPETHRAFLATYTAFHHAVVVLLAASSLLVVLTFLLVWLRPRSLGRIVALVLMGLAFAAMGSAEWVREDMRLPYLIVGHLYVNQVPVAKVAETREKGILAASPFMSAKKVTPENEVAIGKELFRAACSACHQASRGFNALAPRFAGLDRTFVASLVQKTDLMRGGMPPFPGNADEALAIARYLIGLAPAVPVSNDGSAVFDRRCGMCHTLRGRFRPMVEAFEGQTPEDIADTITSIDMMSDKMPAWTGNAVEKAALAAYLAEQAKVPVKAPVKEAAP